MCEIAQMMITHYPTFLVKKGLTLMDGPLAQARPTLPPPPAEDEGGLEEGEGLGMLVCVVEDLGGAASLGCDLGVGVEVGEELLEDDGLGLQ